MVKVTRYDKVLLVFFILLGLSSLAISARLVGDSGESREVIITRAGREYMRFALSDATRKTIGVTGPIGTTLVEAYDGRVRVRTAPCRRKICIRQGWISRPNESIVCAPNKVVVSISSAREPRIDAVIR